MAILTIQVYPNTKLSDELNAIRFCANNNYFMELCTREFVGKESCPTEIAYGLYTEDKNQVYLNNHIFPYSRKSVFFDKEGSVVLEYTVDKEALYELFNYCMQERCWVITKYIRKLKKALPKIEENVDKQAFMTFLSGYDL